MEFNITVYKDSEKVLVESITQNYIYKGGNIVIELLKGKKVPMNIDLAKAKLGDWEKENDNLEKIRRQNKGISSFKLNIKFEEKPAIIEEMEDLITIKELEPEFAALEPVQIEEVIEKVLCAAVKKDGTPCKKYAEPGESFCNSHKE